jgi:hypothetical protein
MSRENAVFQHGHYFSSSNVVREKGETRQAPMAVRHCPVYSPSPANRISPAKLYLCGTSSKYSASTWRWAAAHPPKLIGPASSAGEEFPRFPHYWTRRSSSSCLRLCLWVLLNIVDARLCLNQTQTRTIDSRSDPRIYTSQLPAFQRVYTQSTASHPHQQALLIASHPDRSQRWRAGLIASQPFLFLTLATLLGIKDQRMIFSFEGAFTNRSDSDPTASSLRPPLLSQVILIAIARHFTPARCRCNCRNTPRSEAPTPIHAVRYAGRAR